MAAEGDYSYDDSDTEAADDPVEDATETGISQARDGDPLETAALYEQRDRAGEPFGDGLLAGDEAIRQMRQYHFALEGSGAPDPAPLGVALRRLVREIPHPSGSRFYVPRIFYEQIALINPEGGVAYYLEAATGAVSWYPWRDALPGDTVIGLDLVEFQPLSLEPRKLPLGKVLWEDVWESVSTNGALPLKSDRDSFGRALLGVPLRHLSRNARRLQALQPQPAPPPPWASPPPSFLDIPIAFQVSDREAWRTTALVGRRAKLVKLEEEEERLHLVFQLLCSISSLLDSHPPGPGLEETAGTRRIAEKVRFLSRQSRGVVEGPIVAALARGLLPPGIALAVPSPAAPDSEHTSWASSFFASVGPLGTRFAAFLDGRGMSLPWWAGHPEGLPRPHDWWDASVLIAGVERAHFEAEEAAGRERLLAKWGAEGAAEIVAARAERWEASGGDEPDRWFQPRGYLSSDDRWQLYQGASAGLPGATSFSSATGTLEKRRRWLLHTDPYPLEYLAAVNRLSQRTSAEPIAPRLSSPDLARLRSLACRRPLPATGVRPLNSGPLGPLLALVPWSWASLEWAREAGAAYLTPAQAAIAPPLRLDGLKDWLWPETDPSEAYTPPVAPAAPDPGLAASQGYREEPVRDPMGPSSKQSKRARRRAKRAQAAAMASAASSFGEGQAGRAEGPAGGGGREESAGGVGWGCEGGEAAEAGLEVAGVGGERVRQQERDVSAGVHTSVSGVKLLFTSQDTLCGPPPPQHSFCPRSPPPSSPSPPPPPVAERRRSLAEQRGDSAG